MSNNNSTFVEKIEMKKQFVWFKILKTGLMGFVHKEYWDEMNYASNSEYQIRTDSDKFWEMKSIAEKK